MQQQNLLNSSVEASRRTNPNRFGFLVFVVGPAIAELTTIAALENPQADSAVH